MSNDGGGIKTMIDCDYVIGAIPFSIVFRRQGERLQCSMTVETSRGEWTSVFGDGLIDADQHKMLEALISLWTNIAGPFGGHSSNRFSFDLSLLACPAPTERVLFIREGYQISYISHEREISLGSESVIPVEVMLALGNLLAANSPTHLAKQWQLVSSSTELPPFPLMGLEDLEQPSDDMKRETEWYARALGHGVGEYLRAANWLHARHMAFAAGQDGYSEPGHDEWDVRSIPSLLPSDAEIDAIYRTLAVKYSMTVAELRRQAIALRNADARLLTVFERFFPRS